MVRTWFVAERIAFVAVEILVAFDEKFADDFVVAHTLVPSSGMD